MFCLGWVVFAGAFVVVCAAMEKEHNSSKGYLLAAMPKLADPNFYRTVTIVAEHNREGALGVILNRPLTATLGDALEGVELGRAAGLPVHFGGPVDVGRAWYLHAYKDLVSDDDMVLGKGLYLGASMEGMRNILAAHGGDDPIYFRFFIGYAGWGPGQLEGEMAGSSWITAPADVDFIFTTPAEKLWEKTLKIVGADPFRLSADTEEMKIH